MISSVPLRALLGTLLLGGVLTASLLVSPSETFATLESVSSNPYHFGLLVVGLYAIRPLFAWPTTPLAFVVGYGYGVTLGIPVALLGVVLTVLPPFLVTRWLVSTGDIDACSVLPFGGILEWSGEVVTRYYDTAGPVRGVTASRLAPIPSDVSTCAAAVSGVRLRQLLVGTVLGELPWTVAAVIVGASAATITSGGLGELSIAVAMMCVLAAMVLLAGPVYRFVRTRDREVVYRNGSEQS